MLQNLYRVLLGLLDGALQACAAVVGQNLPQDKGDQHETGASDEPKLEGIQLGLLLGAQKVLLGQKKEILYVFKGKCHLCQKTTLASS